MLNEYLITTYEITPLTLAILPQEQIDGVPNSYVLEESREYTIETTPIKVIDEACKFFGSSLQGRLDGTRDISNITHKAPVAIDPSSGMYFFPTFSPMNNKCAWIAHSHVKTICPTEFNQTEIIFINGRRIIVDASIGSIQNQLQRTAQFRYELDQRISIIKNEVKQKYLRR